jgi:electron transport complex protein RnfA
MGDLIWILVSAMVVNNFTLALFLGLCPFMGVSGQVATALRMGLANIFVLTITSICAWLLNTFVLVYAPYLRLIAFIVVIASLVQIVEMTIKKVSPVLFRQLGIFLPLITTNCAVLGVAIINVQKEFSLLETVVFSVASAAGFGLALVLFAGIRERFETARIPKPLRGTGIGLVTAGLMALSFYAFKGMI